MRKKRRKGTKDQLRSDNSYDSAMRQALARKPFLKTDGRYLSREEVHDRSRFVDSNLLIYAIDEANPKKHAAAKV